MCQKLSRGLAQPAPVYTYRRISTLNGNIDRYNGVTVSIRDNIPPKTSVQDFHKILKESVKKWRQEERTAVWLQMSLADSRYIEAVVEEGFTFHNAEDSQCLLKLWLRDSEDATPRFATHQLGVCGVVLREDTKEVLVIQERKSQFSLWKFPGGLADLGENIGDAAVRETFEETGVKTEFASVIAFRQQHEHPSAFGRSDLYVVCRLRPLTFDIVPCDREVLKCRWMPLEELREHIQIASITHRITSLILHGLMHGFESVDITAEQMQSVYKGMHFTIFHRHLPNHSE